MHNVRGTATRASGRFLRHPRSEAALRTPTELVSKDGPVAKRSLFVRYGMLVCCLAMVLPIAGYLLSGGTFGGLLDHLALAVPLVACVGTHFALHRLTGKSCHGGNDESDAPARPSWPDGTRGGVSSHWTDVIHRDRLDPPPPPANAAVRPKARSRGSGNGPRE